MWQSNGKPKIKKNSALISACTICGDPLLLRQEIQSLEKGGVDSFHIDVMDGVFVPRIGQGPEVVKAIRKITKLPIDVHLMITNPEDYIPVFVDAGADIIITHVEASPQLSRILKLIRKCGAHPGVALSPSTPISVLTSVLGEFDVVMLMAVNPGSVGEKLIPATLQKIADIRDLLSEKEKDAHIMVDGNVTLENAIRMIQLGTTILACGTSSIYRQKQNLKDSLKTFRCKLEKGLRS